MSSILSLHQIQSIQFFMNVTKIILTRCQIFHLKQAQATSNLISAGAQPRARHSTLQTSKLHLSEGSRDATGRKEERKGKGMGRGWEVQQGRGGGRMERGRVQLEFQLILGSGGQDHDEKEGGRERINRRGKGGRNTFLMQKCNSLSSNKLHWHWQYCGCTSSLVVQ